MGADPTTAIGAGVQAGVANGLSVSDATIVSGAAVQTALAGGDAGAVVSAFATDAYAQTARYFLGPINPGLAMFNQVGDYSGQFQTEIPGTRDLDTWQFQTTLTKIFGPLMGADQGLLLWEGAVHNVSSMPDKSELRFEGPGTYVSGNPILGPAAHAGKPIEGPEHFADATSWGYRLVGRLDYLNAFGGFNVSPRFGWRQDVDGVSPGPGGAFLDGLTALTLGLGFNRQNTWELDLSWTTFSGAGRYNLSNDRDFIAANIKYSF